MYCQYMCMHAARSRCIRNTISANCAHEYEKCHVNKLGNHCLPKRSAWLRSSSICTRLGSCNCDRQMQALPPKAKTTFYIRYLFPPAIARRKATLTWRSNTATAAASWHSSSKQATRVLRTINSHGGSLTPSSGGCFMSAGLINPLGERLSFAMLF